MTRESESLASRRSAKAGVPVGRSCAVCGVAPEPAGSKRSDFSCLVFELASCPACHFSFVVSPRTDYAQLYDEAYYRGNGADPLVDYEREITDPRGLRLYEWRGLVEIVGNLTRLDERTRWLDFGCGLGGLVRYARRLGYDVVGHDEGYSAERLRSDRIPFIERGDFERLSCGFDVVTAIEVIEHLTDPVAMLRDIAGLLKPGGVLFVTTGNAAPFRQRLSSWQYVKPDVHIGFFEPETLARAYRAAGLEPEFPGYVPGFADVIRFKVLKTAGVKRQGVLESLVPWSVASHIVDRRYSVTAQPIARKPAQA